MKDITFNTSNNTESFTVVDDKVFLTTFREFKIDYSKISSLEDVVCILKAMDLTVLWSNNTCPEQFKDIYERGMLIEKR